MTYQSLVGWFDWDAVYRRWVMTAPKGATIVEVGVCFGRSLAFLAHEAIEQKRDDLVLYGVDPWVTPDWLARDLPELLAQFGGFFNAFSALMHEHAPAEFERVNVVRATSVQAARMFDDASVFGCFIDGDHAEAAVKADIAAWHPKIAAGGSLGGHDYGGDHPGPEQAVHSAFGNAFEVEGSSWMRKVIA